jgi:hypothetical protein
LTINEGALSEMQDEPFYSYAEQPDPTRSRDNHGDRDCDFEKQLGHAANPKARGSAKISTS